MVMFNIVQQFFLAAQPVSKFPTDIQWFITFSSYVAQNDIIWDDFGGCDLSCVSLGILQVEVEGCMRVALIDSERHLPSSPQMEKWIFNSGRNWAKFFATFPIWMASSQVGDKQMTGG